MFKISKKIGKGGILLMVLLVSAVLVGATVMSFYGKHNTSTNANKIFEWTEDAGSNWEEMSDLEKSYTVGEDFVGGDTVIISDLGMKYSSNANNVLNVSFSWSDNYDSTGVYIDLQYNDSGVWTTICDEENNGFYEFTANDELELRILIVGDTYLESGTYGYDLNIVRA